METVNNVFDNNAFESMTGNIKSGVLAIDKSYKVIKVERANIKINSNMVLSNILKIVKMDTKELDAINPTYKGLNHKYVKVQQLLADCGEIDKSTDKMIKSILYAILVADKVKLENFVESFKELDLLAKFHKNLHNEHFANNSVFHERVNKIIEAKTFVALYTTNISEIDKDLKTALSKITVPAQIITACDGESVWNSILKKYKINDTLLDAFIVALKGAKELKAISVE
jgi:hypothetical protein